jgi:catechol 2,3-dioxygenase-like lactoylglutathione lyase family enzyme
MAEVLGSARLIGFVGTADIDRSRAFYEETLGLELIEQDDFACVFSSHGTMLRVTAVPEVVRAEYTVLGWDVPDIRETVHALKANGVSFRRYSDMGIAQDEDDVWTAPNDDLVAWFTDPDGHVLSVTQFTATER